MELLELMLQYGMPVASSALTSCTTMLALKKGFNKVIIIIIIIKSAQFSAAVGIKLGEQVKSIHRRAWRMESAGRRR